MVTEAPSGTGGLQFDRAEFGSGITAACTACRRPIHGYYYEVNRLVACEALTCCSMLSRVSRPSVLMPAYCC